MVEMAYKSRGTGRPIVFLHGLGGSSDSWNPQLESFGADHRAIAVDLPGYGATPPSDPPTFAAWAEALAKLAEDLDLPSFVLCGHSLGGMVAQEFMIKHSGRVSHLVLSCTSAAFGSSDRSFQEKFLAQRLKALDDGGTMRDVADRNVPHLFSAGADPRQLDRAAATMMSVPEVTFRAALNGLVAFDRREELKEIETPTLLIAAEHDRAAPAKGVRRMADAMQNGTYGFVADAGHLPNIETPERFDMLIRNFIAG